MSHRERIEELVETEQPGLAEWVAGEDARLDADREAQLRLVDRGRWEKIIAAQTDAAIVGEDPFMRDGVIGPLVDVLSDHAAGDTDPKAARRTRARKVRDPNTKWGDEIEALRALAASEVQVRSGDLDRTPVHPERDEARLPSQPERRQVVAQAVGGGPAGRPARPHLCRLRRVPCHAWPGLCQRMGCRNGPNDRTSPKLFRDILRNYSAKCSEHPSKQFRGCSSGNKHR